MLVSNGEIFELLANLNRAVEEFCTVVLVYETMIRTKSMSAAGAEGNGFLLATRAFRHGKLRRA